MTYPCRGARKNQDVASVAPAAQQAVREKLGSELHDAYFYNSSPLYEPFLGGDKLAKVRAFRAAPMAAADNGEQVLLSLIRAYLGPKVEAFTIRRMNATPLKAGILFTYVIQQGSEQADMRRIESEMASGRLYRHGMVLTGGAWSRLLFGPRFAVGASRKQVHELIYRRRSCSCLACLVRRATKAKIAAADVTPLVTDEKGNPEQKHASLSCASGAVHGTREDRSYSMPTFSRDFRYLSDAEEDLPSLLGMDMARLRRETVAETSAAPLLVSFKGTSDQASKMVDAVQRVSLPPVEELLAIPGAMASTGVLQLGEVVNVNSRSRSRLKILPDIIPVVSELAFSGHILPDALAMKVTAMAAEYYKVNRGKRCRKVYLRGHTVRVPIEVGVTKVPLRPLYNPDVGAGFILHARQTYALPTSDFVDIFAAGDSFPPDSSCMLTKALSTHPHSI
jgi:hypothetical protein